MASTLTPSRSYIATSIRLCLPRGRRCPLEIRHSRSYYGGTRYRWSYGTYPKSLKSLDPHIRLPNTSDNVRVCYARTKNALWSYKDSLAPPGSWRAASSWGRWAWDLDKSVRKMQGEINENKNDAAAWNRTVANLDKDTTELYELIKKRIDADPFDALFGRNPLHSSRARASWWSLGGSDRDPQKEQQPPSTSSKAAKAAGDEVVNEQGADRTSETLSSTRHHSASSDQNRFTGSSSFPEEHDIDLITMRKVPKAAIGRTLENSMPSKASEQTFDIPVKPFEKIMPEKLSRQPIENGEALKPNPTASQDPHKGAGPSRDVDRPDWLSQEGFGSKKESQSRAKSPVPESVTETLPTRIESALERHMRKLDPDASVNGAGAKLTYEPKENQTEDVDLLRASDIRAASAAATRLRKPTELEKNESRMKLEANFAALQKMEAFELEWKKDLAAAKRRIQEAEAKKRNKARDEHLEEEVQAQKAAMEALEMRRAGDGTSSSIATVAHPEHGEGDMASNVHEFARRDRWYKRKAPHAATIEEQKSTQIAKARALVRDIRGIYEDTYGTIDAKHRQPDKTKSDLEGQKPSSSSPNGPRGTLVGATGEVKKATKANGPLSTEEKIGTMLQQLLDDSNYVQKLLRTPELTSQTREEIFHRNRSMRNASDAIAEALSSTPSEPSRASVRHGSICEKKTAKGECQLGPQPASFSGDVNKSSTVYNVLAYDPSIQQVTTAEMSSSGDSSSERKLSLSEALSSLTDPVKFLPQLTELQSRGFEIVSSDTNILVLKKNNKPRAFEPDTQATIDQRERQGKINPIDGMTTQTETVASPEGFTSRGSKPPTRTVEGKEAESNSSRYKVRREEDVFSGSNKSRYRRTSRRRKTTMLWVGLWTAGCCYAVGAITELLRA
ncbi:MAG: hypothetical protein Q9168_000808 [Polycauliona sp. 1 TL-2023]